MPLFDAGLDLAAAALRGQFTHVSLHTANPGPSGANEVAGGGYARRPVAWSAVTAGDFGTTGPVEFLGPASAEVTHAAVWSAATGGTCYGAQPLSGDTSFNAAGQLTLLDLSVDGISS